MPAKRRPLLGSDPTNVEADATFVFSRAAIGLGEGETTSERVPVAPRQLVPVVNIPRPLDSETATTGVYLPFTDDDERPTVDEPVFHHDGSATATKRDTIPMPPRKE